MFGHVGFSPHHPIRSSEFILQAHFEVCKYVCKTLPQVINEALVNRMTMELTCMAGATVKSRTLVYYSIVPLSIAVVEDCDA